eukprot:6221657-Pyramimonas_sp.AAC.1
MRTQLQDGKEDQTVQSQHPTDRKIRIQSTRCTILRTVPAGWERTGSYKSAGYYIRYKGGLTVLRATGNYEDMDDNRKHTHCHSCHNSICTTSQWWIRER